MRAAALPIAVVAVLAAGGARAEVSAEGAPKPWLGISLTGTPYGHPIVVDVHPSTAAADAGLQPGDEIVSFGAHDLGPGVELYALVTSHRVGARVPFSFVRDGRLHTAVVRLTAKPTIDEIVHRRLIDRAALPFVAYDRDGRVVPAAERARRPQVWAVFDVHCDPCAAQAAALAARLAEAGVAGRPPLPLRVVLVGKAEEAAAYLARVPVLGTVWRMDRNVIEEDPYSGGREVAAGRRYLSGLDPAQEGVLLVLDDDGVVRFATALSLGRAAHDGACAVAARFARSWRR